MASSSSSRLLLWLVGGLGGLLEEKEVVGTGELVHDGGLATKACFED
jgi:hypothetical protein